MTGRIILTACALLAALGAGCTSREEAIEALPTDEIARRNEAYAPYEMTVPWDLLDENEQTALRHLYDAAVVMDELFLRQVDEGNVELRERVRRSGDETLQRFFRINVGPWDRLAGDEPVIGSRPKPPGAAFYPADMTKEEFEAHIAAHPGEREAFEGTFTVIRRDAAGGLVAVPYAEAWRDLLETAKASLDAAADATGNASLAAFLRLRGAAFLSNDYFESDMAWMDVRDNLLDVTIGPYEVYEDNLFNYKAAFEAFVCIRDPEESRKLDGLKAYLVRMEKNLPIPDEYKNLARGTESPISVADVVFSAGDTKAGVQTLAFNLPNDERVREAKGCKKVMLRNICHAKFDRILRPIAERLVDSAQLDLVTFDAYFNHILLHEFSHGLGPGRITLADGVETTVNRELRETYSAIEEAKADIVGQYNVYYLVDDGFFPASLGEETAVTYLAGFFRSVRFGIEAAHGAANMMAFNFFREKGAYLYDEVSGRWSVDTAKIRGAVEDFSREILMIQAHGDYAAAKRFLETYGVMGDEVRASLARLDDVPVDIDPRFAIEKEFGKD
ncbi:MAG: peptidase [Candidatus Krumholzibacteriota bacterium]|nr:peptidase [Candidatus Krumholzibacteriota bacterium]